MKKMYLVTTAIGTSVIGFDIDSEHAARCNALEWDEENDSGELSDDDLEIIELEIPDTAEESDFKSDFDVSEYTATACRLIENTAEELMKCSSLDQLCDGLNEINELCEAHPHDLTFEYVVDTSSLPTFGTRELEDTAEVYSWDDNRIMIGGNEGWKITARCSFCGEAPFHCNHE